MIVDLTTAQADAVSTALRACGLAWAAERWCPTWQSRPGRVVMLECLMPAVGWEQTLTCLVEVSVGPRGGNRKDAAQCALNARQRIAKALSVYGAHPALYGVGLVGPHADVFPVWRLNSQARGSAWYSIYPMPKGEHEFVHLVPIDDGRYTHWEAVPAAWSEHGPNVLNPDEHRRFNGREGR